MHKTHVLNFPSLPPAIPVLLLAKSINIYHTSSKGPLGKRKPGSRLVVPDLGSPCANTAYFLECFLQFSLNDSAEGFCITSDHSLTVLTGGNIS